ncbi:MAG: ABC transporter permease subunit [bacterium]|nr:ABC transporter permease subunit [bacterium]
MWTVFLRVLNDRKISLAVYCLVGIVLLWMFIILYPIIEEQASVIMELFEGLPEGFLKAFGADSESFTTVEGFLAAKQYSATWPIMVILLLVALAGTVIAGEIEKGSIEISLSNPVSRLRIFFGRYSVGFIGLLAFTVCSVFSLVPLAAFYDVDIGFSNVLKLSIITSLFGLTVLSLSMLLSSIFSEKNKVYMFVGGVMVVMYMLNVVALIKEDIDYIKYASFFHFLETNGALILNEIGNISIIVFAVCSIAFTIIGAWWFNKRDIAV